MNKEIQEKVKKYSLTEALIRLYKADLKEFIENPEKKFNISKLLKVAREKSGKSVEELSASIGTHPINLGEVEECNLKISFNELNINF